ncbi:MAG: glycosyl transferase group 1 [Mucilaginibacter sp.]|nr:glycosyl transferase group 1 [Mucilaginibacter sp.]
MVLKNKVIVFLGNTHFDGAIKATSVFLAREMAVQNKVFFIDYPLTLKDLFTPNNPDDLEISKKKSHIFSGGLIDTDLPNLKIIITPPVIPINFFPEGKIFRAFLKVNEAIISHRINAILKKEGITDFIYINSFNFHYPHIAKLIKPSISIYQCVDPMIIPYDMKHGIISESELVKESDLVICTSRALYNEKKQLNSKTYFVPNAADVDHCSLELHPDLPIHEKLKDLPKPIIGYLGTIERRIDYELLLNIIAASPNKTFVFVGPVWESYVPEELFNAPNARFIGPVPYDEMPQIIKGFDVAIIPFKKDEVSKTIFPLKLFEYLSAGKPVVATDFNDDLKEYTGDMIKYCSDADSFIQSINEELKNDSPVKMQQRLALAKENTWENRSDKIEEIINSHLKPHAS